MIELEPLGRGTSTDYVACAGIWVMTLFGQPSKADMLLARPTLVAMKEKHPAGFPTLTWILPEAGYRMDADARVAAADVTTEFDSVIRAQATLVSGTGFQAATVRAILSGLDAMSRAAGAEQVFADLGPAVTWCLERRAEPAAALAVDVTARLVSMRFALPIANA